VRCFVRSLYPFTTPSVVNNNQKFAALHPFDLYLGREVLLCIEAHIDPNDVQHVSYNPCYSEILYVVIIYDVKVCCSTSDCSSLTSILEAPHMSVVLFIYSPLYLLLAIRHHLQSAQTSEGNMFVQKVFFVNTEILQISMYTMILN
jgi:hypothetical protein